MEGVSALGYLFFCIVFLVIVAYPIKVFNRFVLLSNNTDKAFANIDVWLQQRNEELPNLSSIIVAYAEHEKSTMEKIMQLRDQYESANSTNKVASANALTTILKTLFVRSEANLEIEANSIYQGISARIIRLEGQIEDQRVFFNDSVTIFNNELQRIPQCWFAWVCGFKPKLLLTEVVTDD